MNPLSFQQGVYIYLVLLIFLFSLVYPIPSFLEQKKDAPPEAESSFFIIT